MAIISLSSDLGTRDYYVAAVKGAIYKDNEAHRIVDVSHDISPFNLMEAAHVLKEAYPHFPEGTIHIISVDSESANNERGLIEHVIIKQDGHFFIGPDNGIFSLMFPNGVELVYNLNNLIQNLGESTFPMLNLYSQAAIYLISGGTPSILGSEKADLYKARSYDIQEDENGLTGTIVYIDSFGNVITNIHKSMFSRVGNGRSFECFIRNTDYGINKICEKYGDVERGNALAIFTNSGFLQIAINHGANGAGGGAASLFGLQLFSQIRIEFQKTATSLADF